jgi:cardiolipin synthase
VKTFGEALTGADQCPALSSAGELHGQVVSSRSFSVAPIPLVQAVAFTAAQKRIWITNSYCTPTSDQVEHLVKAVQRGVDVRILLPGENNDQPLTKSAGRAAYGKMLEGGVKIFEYQPTMIHEKSMVIDGLFSMFGSSNLDARSSEINEELDVVVYDQKFGDEMEAVFERDLQQSREYTLQEFKNRSLWERTTEWLMLPFRSQL